MSDRSPFVPDAVLPSQFFGTRRSQTRPKPVPEYRLLIALLEDALECFQKYVCATSRKKRRLFAEAEQWIMGDERAHASRAEPTNPAFSFEYVCEVLDIEPTCVRGSLRRWRAAQEKTVPSAASVRNSLCSVPRRRLGASSTVYARAAIPFAGKTV
jgi:hypothetical protein